MTSRIRRVALGALLTTSTTMAALGVSITAAEAAPAVTASTRSISGPINLRAAPTTKSAVVGKVANGAKISIACQVSGEHIRGFVHSTAQWNRLTNGRYISHGYVRTNAAIASCHPPARPAPPPVPAPPAPVAGPVGSMTNAQFIAASVLPAQQGQREFHVPASVTIAQAILESGWGRSKLTANDRNYFGIKCFNASPGPIAVGCHTYNTYECEPACRPTTASFRVYANITDSFRDHGRFLTTNSRYRPAFAHTGNSDQFLYEIWRAGYATSPTYVDNVKALMRQYDLYRYDLR